MVILGPEPETIRQRDRDRSRTGYSVWSPDPLVDEVRTATPRLGLWVDSTRQSPVETVDEILSRIGDARLPD